MAGGKNIDINNLREAANLLRDIQGISLDSSLYSAKANAELKEFLDTNNAYKNVLKELAELEEKIQNARDIKNKREENKLLKEREDFLEKHKKQLSEIKDKTEEINNVYKERYDIDSKIEEMQKGINVELEKERRAVNKAYELYQLQTKEIREGLTYEEKRYQLLTKIGEKMKINTDQFKKGFSGMKEGIEEFKNAINGLNKAWGEVSQSSADFTRRIGGSKASMEALRKSTIDFMNTRSIGMKYNASMEELIKLQGDYNASLGRSIDLTGDQQEKFLAMKRVVGDQAAMEFTTKLENFGLNPDEVGDRVGKMFNKATKSGLAFEKYSKNFLDNIKLAQNYTFKDGLRGLESMAKKATQIKMDMQQVARFADKVSTLEGAVQAGAQLSVLGGSFAQYGNPLQMLYEGINDMEGLQDRMIGMFSELGKWDYSKGQIDVSASDRLRIKAAAEGIGVDYSAIMEQINASARRSIVEGKLGNKYNNDEDFKELLLNKAQLDKNGNAFVTIRGEKKDINSLSKEDQNYLKTSNTSDSDNIAEIAVNTRGFKDITEGFEKQKDAYSANFNETLHIGEMTEGLLNSVGKNGVLMTVLGVGKDVLSGIRGTLKSFYYAWLWKNAFGKGGIMRGDGMPRGGVSGGGMPGGMIPATRFGGGAKYFGNFGGSSAGLRSASQFANSSFGRVVTLGGSKTGLGRRAIGNIARAGGYGKYLMRGAGVGAGLGIAGAVGDYFIDKSSLGKDKGNHIGGYTAAKAGTGALKGAGIGATIGSVIPVIGTGIGAAIGAGIGAIVGGVKGNIEAKKEAKANILRTRFGAHITDANAYSIEELERMQFGTSLLPAKLYQKMKEKGDNLGGFKHGGYTGEGNPNEIAGNVHKGEIVIPSTAVKASGNLMNPITISSNKQHGNNINNNEALMKVDPININLSGDLRIGGEKVDPQKVLESITPQLIDRINDGLVDRRNFRIDRNKTHMKYKS